MDEKDTPIDPQKFLYGIKVVDFGDIRVSRGLSRRPHTSCLHVNLIFDRNERRIWCSDCEKNVDPFDAFESIANNMSAAISHFQSIKKSALEAQDYNIHLIAAKNIEKLWRGKKLAPVCPHCRTGLLPDDFKSGCSAISFELEKQRRKKDEKK